MRRARAGFGGFEFGLFAVFLLVFDFARRQEIADCNVWTIVVLRYYLASKKCPTKKYDPN